MAQPQPTPALAPLRAALHALYHSRDAAERHAADAWLQAFTHSEEAWCARGGGGAAVARAAVDG